MIYSLKLKHTNAYMNLLMVAICNLILFKEAEDHADYYAKKMCQTPAINTSV